MNFMTFTFFIIASNWITRTICTIKKSFVSLDASYIKIFYRFLVKDLILYQDILALVFIYFFGSLYELILCQTERSFPFLLLKLIILIR